jgi:CelD/BcsL family acetyltransferase involved in cellulose biosynthesis
VFQERIKRPVQPSLAATATTNGIAKPALSSAAEPELRVCVYDNLRELVHLQPAWEELLSASPMASIFSTWEWLVPWWRAFGGCQKLIVLAFYDSRSSLVGLAPLELIVRRKAGIRLKIIRLMGDGSGDSDNLDVLVRPGFEAHVTSAFFKFIQKEFHLWDICELNRLPEASTAGRQVLHHVEANDWPHLFTVHPRSAVILPETWECYQNMLSSKERGKINYLSRRLEKKYEVRFYRCTRSSDLSFCLESLFELHQKRWEQQGDLGAFCSVARRGFYHEMSHLLLERGRLQFWLLELEGKSVAALFGFRYRDTVYALQEGFDPSHSADSVGYVLRAHMLKQLIAAGVRRYDFLAGNNPSKARWGAREGEYMDIHFARPFSRGSLWLHTTHNARRSKEWLRSRLPGSAWNVLHRMKLHLGSKRRKPSLAAQR